MQSQIEELYRSLRAIDDFKMGSFDLMGDHPGQAASLILIRLLADENGRAPKPSQLSEYSGVMPATITAMLNKLESRGLIERECSKLDRREVFIRLTQEGENLCGIMKARASERFSRLEEFAGPEAVSQFIAFARKVEEFNRLEAARETPPGAPPADWRRRRRRHPHV